MNGILKRRNGKLVAASEELTELVRGCDPQLMSDVEALVRWCDVTLDCGTIERIDAAGIATLISLYGRAREAGHTFNVCNVKAHVAEMLGLVGLDHILVTQDNAMAGGCGAHASRAAMERTAA